MQQLEKPPANLFLTDSLLTLNNWFKQKISRFCGVGKFSESIENTQKTKNYHNVYMQISMRTHVIELIHFFLINRPKII